MWIRRAFFWRWCSNSKTSASMSKSIFRLSNLNIQRFSRSFHKHSRAFSILNPSFITDLSHDIDIDGLKDELAWQKKLGNYVTIQQLMNKALEHKCSEVIKFFSVKQARMLKVIQLEHSFLHAEGHDITDPEMMTNRNWIEAMTHPSIEERLHYYLYIQNKASLRAEQAELRGAFEIEDFGETDDGFLLQRNMASRLGDHNLASAMTHGIPLVFDVGFDDFMTTMEFGHMAKQLWLAHLANRNHPNPFHFIFADCKRTNILYRTLQLRYLLQCQHFLVSEMDESYLDLFDRSKLVYLSSSAKHVLKHFDPSRVYILGAFADPKHRKKLGPARAKEQGIECLKLPIDDHVKWIQGTKDLNLHQVVNVLLSVNSGMEWKDAFANVLVHGKNFRHYKE